MDKENVIKKLRTISEIPEEKQCMILRINIYDPDNPGNKNYRYHEKFISSVVQGVAFDYHRDQENLVEWHYKYYPESAKKIENRDFRNRKKSYLTTEEMVGELEELIDNTNADIIMFVTGGEWTHNKQWFIDSREK